MPEPSHAMHIEDDVFVVFGRTDTWKGRMCASGAVEFKAAETVLEIASVCKGQRFWDLDDKTTFDEFYSLRVILRVSELIRCPRHLP